MQRISMAFRLEGKIIMKTTTSLFILCLVFSLFFFSCDPRANEPFYLQNTPNCNEGQKLDSLNTLSFIQGEWEWEYILCAGNISGGNDTAHLGLTVNFQSDNTVELSENGQLNQTSNWEIIPAGNGFWGLDIQPGINELYGYLVICDDRVQFNNTPTDGCANYFKRSE